MTMPEIIEFEDYPKDFIKYQIEPFRQEYIPGSRVLCHEGSLGDEVFFQIPKPVALKATERELEGLKKLIHTWWQHKGNAV
jgi:hypothetical protein